MTLAESTRSQESVCVSECARVCLCVLCVSLWLCVCAHMCVSRVSACRCARSLWLVLKESRCACEGAMPKRGSLAKLQGLKYVSQSALAEIL